MLRSLMVIALLAFSVSGYAQGLNYNYAQLSYGQVEFDDSFIDVDGDGFGIEGSFAVADNFHVFGEYQTAGLDFGVDLNLLEAGIGYNSSISDTVDLLARAGFVRVEAEAPGVPSQDESGYSVGFGLRGSLSEAAELNGGIDYVDADDFSGETRIHLGFLYNFTESFSVGVDGTWWDDVNFYRIGARFNF